jgi:hypothetical protein
MYHEFIIPHIPKVTSNPVMSADPRNQAVIGMSDGIPMFKDKSARSVTPGALRTANLPDHLSTKFKFIHLAFLYSLELVICDMSKIYSTLYVTYTCKCTHMLMHTRRRSRPSKVPANPTPRTGSLSSGLASLTS